MSRRRPPGSEDPQQLSLEPEPGAVEQRERPRGEVCERPPGNERDPAPDAPRPVAAEDEPQADAAERPLTAEQLRAVERRSGSLLVRAGAGTGKTTVLVERFVRAAVDDGVPVDAILAITFTHKAAAELASRVRAALVRRGRRDLARECERAWISTIHGLCARVLRAHPLSAGIDPEFRVLAEVEAERLALAAFDRALEGFLPSDADPERLRMVAAYSPEGLRDRVRAAFSHLRSRGERRPALPVASPPAAESELALLANSIEPALRQLASAGDGKQVGEARALLARARSALAALREGEALEPSEVDELVLQGAAKALREGACAEYERARSAYRAWCLERRSYLDHTLLRVLLELYGARYEELKRERSGLDFEDLELGARDLLRAEPGLRELYAGRFEQVLVDEFQDTSPLQSELIELLARDNLFRVGDERQSIYGFRNADLDVFRGHAERAAEAGRVESLTLNFRSRPELLDAVDAAFGWLWGTDYEPLRAPDRPAPPGVGPHVELLVADRRPRAFAELGDEPFGPTLAAAPAWRACEARLLARRIEELAREEGRRWSNFVVLMRATTHMWAYERALEERGIPTHVVGGRGYWSQQQVLDLRHWLAALANPLDELALLSLLASPLVGASLDAVALLRLHGRRLGRDPWWTLSAAFLPGGDGSSGLADLLPPADHERIERFVPLLDGERRAAPRRSLETLVDRAVTLTGYDRVVLAMPAGERRMANVRKLMRMARDYEADEGRDLRGFIDFVAERDLIEERQAEAPLEAEQVDAVRLITVHRAKGLEFPVVCLADLGKEGREDAGPLKLSEDGRVGLQLATLEGGKVDNAELERQRELDRVRDEEEEQRIFYVAVTRAQERLVLSGATDLARRREHEPLKEPMRWVWRAFAPELPEDAAGGVATRDFEGRPVRVRFEACAAGTLSALSEAADRTPARPEAESGEPDLAPPPELAGVPAPPALPVARLSYSGLADYGRCGYRFYLERALRLAPEPARPEAGAEGIGALLRGTIVHELLERLDFRRPLRPSLEEVRAAAERHGARASEAEAEELRELVAGFVGSQLRARVAAARRVRTELPFAFPLEPPEAGGRSLIINGVVDVHATESEGVLVLDYKSDRLEGRDPAEVCEADYGVQRLVYGLAALRAGAPRAEVVHLFLERPGEPASVAYAAADAPRLEAELAALARGIVVGRFEPSATPHAGLCAGCPGQAALCSWPPERTLASAP